MPDFRRSFQPDLMGIPSHFPEGRTPEGRTPEGRTPEGRTPDGSAPVPTGSPAEPMETEPPSEKSATRFPVSKTMDPGRAPDGDPPAGLSGNPPRRLQHKMPLPAPSQKKPNGVFGESGKVAAPIPMAPASQQEASRLGPRLADPPPQEERICVKIGQVNIKVKPPKPPAPAAPEVDPKSLLTLSRFLERRTPP